MNKIHFSYPYNYEYVSAFAGLAKLFLSGIQQSPGRRFPCLYMYIKFYTHVSPSDPILFYKIVTFDFLPRKKNI